MRLWSAPIQSAPEVGLYADDPSSPTCVTSRCCGEGYSKSWLQRSLRLVTVPSEMWGKIGMEARDTTSWVEWLKQRAAHMGTLSSFAPNSQSSRGSWLLLLPLVLFLPKAQVVSVRSIGVGVQPVRQVLLLGIELNAIQRRSRTVDQPCAWLSPEERFRNLNVLRFLQAIN